MKRLNVTVSDQAFRILEAEQARRQRLEGVVPKGQILSELLLSLNEVRQAAAKGTLHKVE